MDETIRQRLSGIRVLFYDFDGVMTDNRVLVDQNGIESVFVNRSDGLAVSHLKKQGYTQVIVSTETNPVVVKRAEKLKIPVIHGIDDKGEIIRRYLEDNNILQAETLFIGNDLNDLSAFETVGIRTCPSDAYDAVKEAADLVLNTAGGDGVIRELMDYLV